MEGIEPAQAHVTQSVTVVGLLERDEPGALGLWVGFLPPVLEGHFEGNFDGRGTAVG